MTLYESYKANRYKKYQTGGPLEEEAPGGGFGSTFQFGATLANGILDATATPDPISGRVSTGTTVGKGALSGAAAGMALGPLGAGIGAVVGAGLGLFNANKQKKEARAAIQSKNDAQFRADSDRSAALLATNPSLLEGYKNSGYFATGGYIGDPGDKNKPIMPPAAGTVYRTQGAVDAANAEAKRLAKGQGLVNPEDAYVARQPGDPIARYYTPEGKDITGVPMQTRKLATSLPKGVTYKDIQMSQGQYWYNDPHTGDLVDVDPNYILGTYFPKTKVTRENGGAVDAPFARMYMKGGYAKSLSSDNTEMVGRTHAEGGIDIPGVGAEVENKETTMGNYVFSDKLGFAQVHKKIAKAKGIIEQKPVTRERVNSMKLLKERENNLMMAQEYLKQQIS